MNSDSNLTIFTVFDSFVGSDVVKFLDPISIIEFLSINKAFYSSQYLWNSAMKSLDIDCNSLPSYPNPIDKVKLAGKLIILNEK